MDYQEEALQPVVAPGLLRRSIHSLRPLVQLVLAAGLLAGLLWRVDLAAVRDDLERATLWWLPLAFVANLASDWFRAIRWREFFRPLVRVDVPFLYATAIVGVACNIVLPLRAGEVVRTQVLRRRTGLGVSSIVATLLSEKLMDIVAFSVFVILGIVLYEEAHFMWPLAVAYSAVLVAGIFGARWLARRSQEEGPHLEAQPEGRWRARIAVELRSFGHGLQAFRNNRAMVTIVWASIAAWLCEAAMYWACGQALGLDLPPAVYLLTVVAATIAVSIPVTQAGLGVFELAITGLMVAFGLSESQAAAFAIFSHVMLAVPYMAAGPLAAFALKLNLSDVLFLRADRDSAAAADV
ncbi:MAG TPA: lysylphosphatidylglycerol synthase transmembrane domain-containing protein [Dehalococcoidia bacterium]|nr:lysylphosphatidylglycerol synthase transmembrane domain-containing protein [Dehalococcoidia bacterium]